MEGLTRVARTIVLMARRFIIFNVKENVRIKNISMKKRRRLSIQSIQYVCQ
jgi:hypothetical protein